jgi:hypothetical protein
MLNFEGEYAVIPELTRAGLERYVLHRIKPGQFLSAVICNDLRNAVSRADNANLPLLPLYVRWFDRYFPALYGSENFINHINGKE